MNCELWQALAHGLHDFRWENEAMAHTDDLSGNYRVEVSGWGLNDAFFVEKTELSWVEGGEKKLLLHHALLEGAIIFIRLAAPENLYGPVPVAYQAGNVQPMNRNGLCEMRLLRLQPRSRARAQNENASPWADSSSKRYEPKQSSIQSELEEVLHEA
jgi:hypothetical protein